MRLRILLLAFITVCCSQLLSQQSGITGIVQDSLDSTNLFGATIKIEDGGATTDYNGQFVLSCNPGEYDLIISYIGYKTKTIKVSVADGKQTSITIALSQSSTVLNLTTITGSKYERSVARSPISINVIKSQLIENTNTVRISSLLDKIPGVQIVDNQAIIRGGSGWSYGAGSRVLLLIDDIPALQGDAGRPLWGDVPVENISQVEVLKGASSTLYGSSAMNGIINIRTGYATAKPVTKAYMSYTHYMDPEDINKKWWDSAPSRLSAGIVHKRRIGKLDLVANGYIENFDSYYENGFENKFRLSANAKYRINDRITIAFNSLYNYAEAADPFVWMNGGSGAYKGADGTFSERNTTRFYIDPQITIYSKNNDRHKFLSRYYYVNNDNNLGQANTSTNTYFEYQYLKSLFGGKTELASGIVGQFIESDSELFGNVKLNSGNIGGFTQLDHKFNDKLTVSAGLRYEYNEQRSPEVFQGDTIPDGKSSESKLISRVGFNYAMDETTFFRASWGQGYRYPTMAEKFIKTTVSSILVFPNVNLQSESGWSSEFGLIKGIKLGTWVGHIDASIFWSQYDNMTEFTAQTIDGSLGFQSVNVGSTDIKGFELSLLGQSTIFNIPVNLIAGYTMVNPKYQEFVEGSPVYNSITAPIGESEKRNFLKYRSKHNFKIDIETFIGQFSIGLSGNYASEVVTMDALLSNFSQIGLYREANPGGYFKFDARLGFTKGNFKLSLHGVNLLNKEYTVRPGLLEPPRNISMRLDVEF